MAHEITTNAQDAPLEAAETIHTKCSHQSAYLTGGRTTNNWAAYTYDAIGQVLTDSAYETSGGSSRLHPVRYSAFF